MSMARRTSASLAWRLASRNQRPSSVRMKTGGHVAGHFTRVVATHAVGQHGQGHTVVGGYRVFIVAARPPWVHGSVELDRHGHGQLRRSRFLGWRGIVHRIIVFAAA
jgi:hypothetical protein